MLFRFFPQEFKFFDLLEEQADYAVAAAVFFKEVVAKGEVSTDSLSKMRDIEHRGDEAAHTIIDRLNRTFITPFDREDIYALTKELDDITDMLYTIVRRLSVYKMTGIDKNLLEFAAVIEDSVRAVALTVRGLRNMKETKAAILPSYVEIHRLENVGDTMRDVMLGQLFETEKDPIMVIKRKEIYEDAETVLDVCEDVANVVESIFVKHA
jgi:uncharacterized protein Yka (UPF0111/DUF47 family)